MKKYHKIQTVYKRNPATKMRTLLEGDFSLPELQYLANCEWEFTEKIDGTNIRVHWDGEGSIVIGGRTDNAQIHADLYGVISDAFDACLLEQSFSGVPVTFYGEGYGHKVQKVGKMYLPDSHSFILFDVRIDNYWLERHNVIDIAGELGIDSVPIWGTGTLYDAIDMVREGFKSKLGDLTAEGLVMRPIVEMYNRRGERVISKIKHRDFQDASKKPA